MISYRINIGLDIFTLPPSGNFPSSSSSIKSGPINFPAFSGDDRQSTITLGASETIEFSSSTLQLDTVRFIYLSSQTFPVTYNIFTTEELNSPLILKGTSSYLLTTLTDSEATIRLTNNNSETLIIKLILIGSPLNSQ